MDSHVWIIYRLLETFKKDTNTSQPMHTGANSIMKQPPKDKFEDITDFLNEACSGLYFKNDITN